MKVLAGILFFLVISRFPVLAQDYQYAQFYALPMYYNPAFSGSNMDARFSTGFRNQWTGLQGWKGWMASYDWYSRKASSGFGIFFSKDQMSRLGYSHSSGMFQYAYRGKFGKKVRVSSGIGVGFGQTSWSFSNRTFGDQLEGDPIRPASLDPLAGQSFSAGYFDMQLGFLVYSQTWWVSVSALHPHSPRYDIQGENTISPRISLSGGYRFEFSKPTDYKDQIVPKSITPVLLIRNQGNYSQMDLGMYLHYVPFVAGLWYRGIPVQPKGSSSINHDALTVLVGIKQNNLSIGYSYDINLSGLVGVLGGSHEITLTYEFKTKYLSLKGAKQSRALPCPSF